MGRWLQIVALVLLIAVFVGAGFGVDKWLSRSVPGHLSRLILGSAIINSASGWITQRISQYVMQDQQLDQYPSPDEMLFSINCSTAVEAGLRSAIAAFVSLVLFALIVVRSMNRVPGETTCRKCGYILRGLQEPRCPECGENI